MPTPVICPDAQALKEYLLGQTPEQAARALEEHVAVCPSCALKLNELTDSDTLAQPLPPQAVHVQEHGGEVEALIGRLCERGHGRQTTEAPAADLLGDFRILREIGRGGMGVVYVAEQISLGRKVALKVLPFAAALDQKQLQRFKNEAQAAAQLHHTNIVPVHYVGCERGVHFYAMQFIDGQSLAGVLDELRQLAGRQRNEKKTTLSQVAQDMLVGRLPSAQSPAVEPTTSSPCSPAHAEKHKGSDGTVVDSARPGPISSQQSFPSPAYFRSVARLGVQAARALEHAHQMGVVHRDVKPANLLVDVHANLWITDFGLAHCQASAGLTMTGDLLGTLRYMSPEQALANRVVIDHRTDIYSLGASLYEMLTLEPAFAGSDRQELLRQIAFEEPRPPRRLTREVPQELETIVLKALEKNPLDRYSTARELADDLQRVLDDQPIRAKRPTLVQRARKWARRHEGVVATVTIALFVAVLILAGSSWLIIRNMNRALQAEKDVSAERDRAKDAEADAYKNLEKALRAEREKTEQLGKAKLAQAEAGRWSGRAGRIFDSVQALADAAQIARSLQAPKEHMLKLRNEAIACLALPDMRSIKEWEKYTPDKAGAALDPGRQRYTTADEQGNISMRALADDREILHLKGPGIQVASVAFSPDGDYLEATYPLESKSNRSRILVWDLQRGEIAFRLTPDRAGSTVVWSPDSRRFAVHSGAMITLLDVILRKEIRRFSFSTSVDLIAFHPNGKQLAILTTPVVQIRDIDTGKITDQFAFPLPIGRIAWGGDGRFLAGVPRHLATGRPDEWHIYVWDVPAGQMHRVLKGHQNSVMDVAFNHAGDLLASTAWDFTVRLWNPWTGKELVISEDTWGALEFSLDDRFLSMKLGLSRARRWWQLKRGREYRTQLYSPAPTYTTFADLDFSPDGGLLASSADDGPRLWDVRAGKYLAWLSPLRARLRFESSGRSLLIDGPSVIQRWPLSHDQNGVGDTLRIGPPENLPLGDASFQDITSDGRMILVLNDRGRLVVWDNSTRLPRTVFEQEVPGVGWSQLSPDGRWVACGSWHGSGATVWDIRGGKLASRLTTDDAGICFSPDGKWLLTGSGKEFLFRDVGSWKTGLTIPNSSLSGGMQFSPDGKLLALPHALSEIGLIDPNTGRLLATLSNPNTRGLSRMVFSPDSSRLAVATVIPDTTQMGVHTNIIEIWDLRAVRQQLARMGLDWDLPSYATPPAAERSEQGGIVKPIQVHVDAGDTIDREKFSLVLAFFPFHAPAYQQRGLAYTRFGQWGEAVADLNRAIALQPGAAPVIYANMAKAVHSDQASVRTCYYHALATLGIGDRAGYRKICRNMLDGFGQDQAPDTAYWLAWTCCLAPGAAADARRLVETAKSPVSVDSRNHHYLTTLGAALYRAGRFADALQPLNEACLCKAETQPIVYTWFFLAMAHHRLGHVREARQWLDKAVQAMDQAEKLTTPIAQPSESASAAIGPLLWNRLLTLQLLRREAEALVRAK